MSDLSYSTFLVWDCEFLCFEGMTRAEQMKVAETIQIGITEVNMVTKTIVRSDSYLVKPKNMDVTAYCTQLTGITKEMLENAKTLAQVSKLIRKTYKQNCYNGAWGNDPAILLPECLDKNVPYPFGGVFLNLQDMYSLKYGLTKTVAMTKVLTKSNIPLEGTLHDAKWDSYNTASILIKEILTEKTDEKEDLEKS